NSYGIADQAPHESRGRPALPSTRPRALPEDASTFQAQTARRNFRNDLSYSTDNGDVGPFHCFDEPPHFLVILFPWRRFHSARDIDRKWMQCGDHLRNVFGIQSTGDDDGSEGVCPIREFP